MAKGPITVERNSNERRDLLNMYGLKGLRRRGKGRGDKLMTWMNICRRCGGGRKTPALLKPVRGRQGKRNSKRRSGGRE